MILQLRNALRRLLRTVSVGIVLTLVTIALVEFIDGHYFQIPKPTALYMIAVAAAALIGGLRSGLISALIVIAFSAWIVPNKGDVPFVYDHDNTARLVLFTAGAPLMAVIVGLLRRRNDDLLREHIRRAHREETAKAELDRERRIAITLQNAILSPIENQTFPNLDIGYCYEAAWAEADVGGDFYDVFALDARTVAVVIGDISGKGLAAAAKTAEIKYTLRAFLHEIFRHGDADLAGTAGVALDQVNNYLLRHETLMPPAPAALSEKFEVSTFACLILAIVRTDTGETDLAVAAMEPPIRIRFNDYGKLGCATEILDVGGLPLGVQANVGYRSKSVCLEPGDALLLTTDGITEARRPESIDMFGLAGLQLAAETALAISSAKPESLTTTAGRIVASAKAFGGRGTLGDDACVLIVRRNASPAPLESRELSSAMRASAQK